LIDRSPYSISVYFKESPNIHCHNMKHPTQLCSFNYFIDTHINHIKQCTINTVNEVYYIDII